MKDKGDTPKEWWMMTHRENWKGQRGTEKQGTDGESVCQKSHPIYLQYKEVKQSVSPRYQERKIWLWKLLTSTWAQENEATDSHMQRRHRAIFP